MTPAVNVIGDFSAVHGLAEAGRRVVDALDAAGVEMSLVEARSGAQRDDSKLTELIRSLPRGKRYPVDLVLLNVNEMVNLPLRHLDRYTIALWYWELLELEQQHIKQYARVDEVWAATDFVADTFRALGAKPVHVMPAVVPRLASAGLEPAAVSLPKGLRVLFTFDANSSVARKNPLACVEAFRRAFTESERGSSAHLIVKVGAGDRYPRLLERLAEEVRSVSGTLIAEHLSRAQMDALLAACDVYLSLHRSEGFGLGMAEAMSLGKSVVGTAFGGNTSFMAADNACLVGYEVREIRAEDHALQPSYERMYRPGRSWAEPDLDQAAAWLRVLADDARYRRRLGERAASHIEAVASPQGVGELMAARLATVSAGLS